MVEPGPAFLHRPALVISSYFCLLNSCAEFGLPLSLSMCPQVKLIDDLQFVLHCKSQEEISMYEWTQMIDILYVSPSDNDSCRSCRLLSTLDELSFLLGHHLEVDLCCPSTLLNAQLGVDNGKSLTKINDSLPISCLAYFQCLLASHMESLTFLRQLQALRVHG